MTTRKRARRKPAELPAPTLEGRLVVISWIDAGVSVTNGWRFLDAIGAGVVECQSAGWVVHDTPQAYVLAANVGHSQGERGGTADQASCTTTIPKRYCVRVIALNPGKTYARAVGKRITWDRG